MLPLGCRLDTGVMTTWSKQYLSAVHPVTYYGLACSSEVPVWPNFDFRFLGQMTPKWKFSKLYFRIPRRDTEIRFVTKFGENRPLRSCRKVAWFTKQKNPDPAPILAKMGRSRPKFPECCHLLACPRIPNLVWIGCVLPDLFRKDWFFWPKKWIQYRLSAYNKNIPYRKQKKKILFHRNGYTHPHTFFSITV